MHYARWRVHGDVDTVKTRLKDLTGQQFGRVVVVSRSPERHGAHPSWIVKCECGNTRTVSGPHLVSGHTKSCGCLRVVADDRSPIRKTYLIYKRNARERGYPFRLPETEFRRITQLPCVYCGATG